MTQEPFVLDATLALAWCFADGATTYSQGVLLALRHRHAVVPATWIFDISRALLTASQRHHAITGAGIAAFLQRLRHLPIHIDYTPAVDDWTARLPAQLLPAITAYDLPYLALARREQLSLATLDDGLRAAARVSGVKLVEVVAG